MQKNMLGKTELDHLLRLSLNCNYLAPMFQNFAPALCRLRFWPVSYRDCSLSIVAAAALLLFADRAFATPPALAAPEETEENESPSNTNAPAPETNFFTDLGRSQFMLGDMGGIRPFLSRFGVTLSILETSEVLGNVTGGSRRGADYEGLTEAVLQLDTDRAFGLYGGTFNVSALQVHGRNLSADNLDTLQTVSGIEADCSTRLWELWYDQKFLDEDRLDVKVGQQSLDQEFIVSQNALLFVNTMFGWPMLPSADLPGGGPAYPLSALGIRVRFRPTNSLTLLAGVFNGSPVSNDNGDPQEQNASGASFPLHGGTLAIAELQFAYPSLGAMVYQGGAQPLSGVYKIGFWYDTENFADQQYDDEGLSLANPASGGNPREHPGDYSIYAVVDQMLWSDPNDPDGDRAINFFTRVMGAPESGPQPDRFQHERGIHLSRTDPPPQRRYHGHRDGLRPGEQPRLEPGQGYRLLFAVGLPGA